VRLIDDDQKYLEPSIEEVQTFFDKRNKDLVLQKQAAREDRLVKTQEFKKKKV